MKRIVLDTNVLASALLKPKGPPARILRLVLQGELVLVLNDEILTEYEDVLARSKFSLDPRLVRAVLDHLQAEAIKAPALPLTLSLPDPEDEPFLEAALAARADALVTGNKRHFPERACQGQTVWSPKEFLEAAWGRS